MLSLGKLAPGQQQYYLKTVARGAEEYYTGANEAPGEWTGQSAARLGLTDEVDADTLGLVLESRDPISEERLTRAQGAPKIPGFDATFCTPKSVSLLFALGEPEASNEVRNVHDASVTAALGVLEAEAARARRGRAASNDTSRKGSSLPRFVTGRHEQGTRTSTPMFWSRMSCGVLMTGVGQPWMYGRSMDGPRRSATSTRHNSAPNSPTAWVSCGRR